MFAAALARPVAVHAQTLTPLQIGGVPEDSITTAVWALQGGIFRKYGLDVKIDAQRSGSATAAAVAGGTYQVGKSSMMSMLVAHGHNVPVVIVAPGGMYEPGEANEGFLVKSDSTIRTGTDLNGKTVAVSAINDLYMIGARSWIDKNGGDSSTVKFVELPIAAIGTAVELGRIDAGGTIEPDLQRALDGGKVRVLFEPNSAIAPRFMYTGWMSLIDYARANKPILERFRQAMHESALFVNANPAQTVDALAKFSGIEPSVIAKMKRIKNAMSVDPRLLQPLVDAAAKYRAIPAGFDARELIDPALR
jgi:NitT/TauT family transport system substrate-binding protein